VEQGLPAGEEQHEKGRVPLPGQLAEPDGEVRRQGGLDHAAAEGLDGRAGEVGRDLQGGEAGQALLPPGELSVQQLRGPAALPVRVVGVLEGELGERLPAVERAHLAGQEVERPAVADDVVQVEEEPGGFAEVEQGGAQERPAQQVERPPRLLAGQPVRLLLPEGRRQGAQVHHGQRPGMERLHDLHRLAMDDREAGAQRLMAPRRLGEGALQGRFVQRTAQVQGLEHVVDRAARAQLVHDPEALLGEGGVEGLAARHPAPGRHGEPVSRGRGDEQSQARHGRGFE
jgi:hypothetical protein